MTVGEPRFGVASQKGSVRSRISSPLGWRVACFSSPVLSGTGDLGKMFEPVAGPLSALKPQWEHSLRH